MTLFDEIITAYPELNTDQKPFFNGTIILRNDSDGLPDYVAVWNYEKPLPEGLKLGK